MDNDVLVIAGFDVTFVFLDHDGTWVESISVVDDGNSLAVSNRKAKFTSDREVSAYNILEDCTQPMLTSMMLMLTETWHSLTLASFVGMAASGPNFIVFQHRMVALFQMARL
jgi:hypothetical protein